MARRHLSGTPQALIYEAIFEATQDPSFMARFWEKVEKQGFCWVWAGGKVTSGYGSVRLPTRIKRHNVNAHRVALTYALGRPVREGLFVLHNCDNRLCVNPEHLREGTHSDNMKDRGKRGWTPKGEASPGAKLTEPQVLDIRRRYPSESSLELSKVFGVSASQIQNIVSRKSWKHI